MLADTIGRLCAGEIAELQTAYRLDRTEAAYLASIDDKTASLFSAACRIGAIVAGLPRHHVEHLTAYGTAYGIAFQVVDDILDLVATESQLGKPAGHDLVEGVYTLPVLRALAGPAGAELSDLLGGPLDDVALAKALALVRSAPAVVSSVDAARAHVDDAVAALAPLGEGPATSALAGAAHHLIGSPDPG